MTNPVQNALNEMHQQWVTDEKEIAALSKYSQQLVHDKSVLSLAEAGTRHSWYWHGAGGSYVTHNEAEIANDQNIVNNDQTAVTNIENTFTKDNGGVSLIAVLNGMLGIGTTVSTLCNNEAYATKYLTILFAALSENLQENLDAHLMQTKAAENNTSASEAAAQQRIHYGSIEQSDLSQFNNMLFSDFAHFNLQYGQAEKDYTSYDPMNFIQVIFGDQAENMSRDKRIETNSAAMMKEITTIMKSLGPAMAKVSSMSFIEIQMILQHIMHKLQDILDDPSSSKSLQSDLNKILGLVMFALGLLGLIEQSQESAKTRYEKEMAEANMDVTKMNMANQQLNQQIVSNEVENASTMKTVSLVATIAIGLVSALMGGIGTAVLMITLTALQASGEMSKITQGLAHILHKNDGYSKKTAKVLADVIVTSLEIVITAGGGAMLDAAIARLAVEENVARVVDAAMNRDKDNIEEAATQAATNVAITHGASPEATALLIATTKEDLIIAAKKAMTLRIQRLLSQFWRQPLLSIKGGLKRLPRLVEEESMAAVANAKKSAEKMAQNIADGGYFGNLPQPILPTSGVRTALVEEIVASSAGKDGAGFFARTAGKRLLRRTLLAAAYGIGNTGLPMDIATATEKYRKKVDNEMAIFMDIIQEILQAISMIGAMSPGITLTQASSQTVRGAMTIQGAAQAAGGASNFQVGEMQEVQADAELRLQIINALSELLHTTLQEMQEALTTSQKAWVEQEKIESQLMNQLALHLYDGENAGNRVLTELAG